MRALKVGRYFGIPVYIHWSFLLVLVFILYVSYTEGMDLLGTAAFSLYLTCVFICVVLHEYGHAMMARRYGIGTHDIILSPIGGIARLNSLPSHPTGELMVAIAGPLVNLAIAFLIVGGLYLFNIGIVLPDADSYTILTNPVGFIHLILLVNVVLFLFNLIPAYPMDGGRILRALLSYKMEKLKATYIASTIGRSLALGFLVFAVYKRIPSLFLIGIFIFIVAGREYKSLKERDLEISKKLEHNRSHVPGPF